MSMMEAGKTPRIRTPRVERLEIRQLEHRPRYREDRARVKRELRAEVHSVLVSLGRVTG